MELESRQYTGRSCLTSMLLIILSIIACNALFVLFLDFSCSSRVEKLMPMYPGAELISETHDLLRPFGLGTTEKIMITSDEPEVVDEYYKALRAELGISRVDVSRYITVSIEPVPEGSRLRYFAYCEGF